MDKSPWELIQIQILPTYQKQGIGNYVLDYFLSKASEINETIELSVLKLNNAINLYKRKGFEVVGETKESYLMTFCPTSSN